MTQVKTRLSITVAVSLGLGILAIIPVVNSSNGYVAGYVYFPLLLLIAISSVILFVVGFAFLLRENTAGLYFLAAMILVPTGFFGSAFIAKHFELGAYREEPMSPIIPTIANKVILKKGATDDDVQKLWREVLSSPVGKTGSDTRPGIQSIGSSQPEEGHEVVLFSFFSNATDEQKGDIRQRIDAYSPVLRYLENVDTTPIEIPIPQPEDNAKPAKSVRQSNNFEYRK
jgi:hypothetical protein